MNISHQPPGYDCPFCGVVAGRETEYVTKQDIVYQDNSVIAFIAPKWWAKNPGHVLVIPKAHHENIYGIPDSHLAAVYRAAKQVAIAMRATYDCDGTSMRQHNEPAGNQDVWHFHVHVFPRYTGDTLYSNHHDKRFVTAAERLPYATKLREYLA